MEKKNLLGNIWRSGLAQVKFDEMTSDEIKWMNISLKYTYPCQMLKWVAIGRYISTHYSLHSYHSYGIVLMLCHFATFDVVKEAKTL